MKNPKIAIFPEIVISGSAAPGPKGPLNRICGWAQSWRQDRARSGSDEREVERVAGNPLRSPNLCWMTYVGTRVVLLEIPLFFFYALYRSAESISTLCSDPISTTPAPQ